MEANSPNKKTDQTSSSIRIRNNQRRSRERRKEYTQDLERRLRKFETEGVQATREVQAAGRKAVEENILLRSLLMMHGVSDQEVREYLEAHTASNISSRSRIRAVVEKAHPSMSAGSETGSGEHLSDSRESRREYIRTMFNMAEEAAKSFSWIYQNQGALFGNRALDDTQRVPLPSASHDASEGLVSRSEASGQSTSCEVAAKIITSMRHHSDEQDVRSELGCQSSSNCMVRNMDIFQLLDE
ncbi:hypothetical protein BDV25DRAFT_147875 [Aspergillus avenaceus]|uniref:BZIP domain-containing protein n=1 Tax=Aspergillus avenaceus TaxID=36643 RepID=A0A5N6U6Q3_ASPAV|nr:hypothetical protein BDV25DRAFT_147875 [Aspergillus avenaceus]